jgi:hypothetical protein
MNILVTHREMNELGVFGNDKEVAVVDAPDNLDTIEMLSYAFRWTNNVDGSWSKPRTFQLSNGEIIHDNGDYNERVKFIGEANPKGYGERSTSVGDLMTIVLPRVGVQTWEVMPNGFREINEAA